MKRIRLTVAYDGTDYCGWQVQPNGMTIEEKLNTALSELLHEEIHIIGASRTDSGVHAMGNLAIFDTETRIPAEKIAMALNTRLPGDIVVQKSEEVPGDYHPRKCNSIKTYEYRILCRKLPDPLRRRYSAFVYWELDAEAMKQGAACLVGEHDFVSFSSTGGSAEDTIRHIYEASVRKEGEEIIIRLRGNGFLYNMVRIIAGTLIEVGRGRIRPEEVKDILVSRNRANSGNKAPAEGLTLMQIEHVEQMPLYEHLVNDFTDYEIDRSAFTSEGKVRYIFHRCTEWERMISRSVVHVKRDGGKVVEFSGVPVDKLPLEIEKNCGKVVDKERDVVIYYISCDILGS